MDDVSHNRNQYREIPVKLVWVIDLQQGKESEIDHFLLLFAHHSLLTNFLLNNTQVPSALLDLSAPQARRAQ